MYMYIHTHRNMKTHVVQNCQELDKLPGPYLLCMILFQLGVCHTFVSPRYDVKVNIW